MRTITEVARPENKLQIKAFVGMVNYYARFIPHLSSMLGSLYELLKENVRFKWSTECENAFKSIKVELVTDRNLVHLPRTCQCQLVCDASNDGIGAVLLHVFPDDSERPICFASRTLSKAENIMRRFTKTH